MRVFSTDRGKIREQGVNSVPKNLRSVGRNSVMEDERDLHSETMKIPRSNLGPKTLRYADVQTDANGDELGQNRLRCDPTSKSASTERHQRASGSRRDRWIVQLHSWLDESRVGQGIDEISSRGYATEGRRISRAIFSATAS